jgi:short-subunit dehydrogenase
MPNIPEAIENSTVVITGASSGFGRGAALELARQGANVVLAARRSKLLDELLEEITWVGGRGSAVVTDVSLPLEVEHLAWKAVEQFGRIDVWINNVGVGALGYFWKIPLTVHARLVDVNLSGLIYGSHTAINHFLEQDGGTLINVGSVDSEVPMALQNTYAATKAAVLSLGRSLNQELRLAGHGDRIRVATIMPWAVDTPWWTHAANYTGHAPRMAAMDDPGLIVDAIVEACTNPKEEIPVGVKARGSTMAHQIFPDMTERMSANLARAESEKAMAVEDTDGAVFAPMEEGSAVGGNIRERMSQEDSMDLEEPSAAAQSG